MTDHGRDRGRQASARRPAAAAAGAAVALLLAGCSTFIPDYQRPAAPVDLNYPARSGAQGSGGEVAADVDWQRYFADERLKQLITIALANNRDLRIAALNIEQARATFQIRRADQLPAIGVGAIAQRQAAGNSALVNVYQVGLAVTGYELDFFGRVRSLSQVALAQYLATEEARKTVQMALIASVANAYLNLLADDELLRVTVQTLDTREESLRLTKLKFDAGAASEIEFRQAESLLEAARVALASTTRQRALDENTLVLLLGRTPPQDLPPGLPLGLLQINTELRAGLPSALLERRPDIRSAEQRLLAANANIGAARAAFFPRITLTANAGTASTQLSGLFKGGTWAVTGTAQLLQPIFDAGRNEANLEVAQLGREIAVAQYERTIQTAFREVADALAGRLTLGEQYRAQRAQANAAEVTFKLVDLRYRNGASSYLDVLDAQRTLFSAQQAAVQVRALQVQNLVTLYQVLGGGWTEPARAR